MTVAIENEYRPEYLFLPSRTAEGKLIGLEIITRYWDVGNEVLLPARFVSLRLSPEQEIAQFKAKLLLVETAQLFFKQQQLLAWITISPLIATTLLLDNELAEMAKRFPFLEFCVHENFPELDNLTESHVLVRLHQQVNLVLSNFGSGDASTRAVFFGLFDRIVFDKPFLQRQFASPAFDAFMRAIVTQVRPYCQSLMAAGVDNGTLCQRLQPYGIDAIQGGLWPAVDIHHLTSLVQQ